MSVDVVRCKDCTYYEGLAECKIIGNCGGTDFYCAYGKTVQTESATEWDGTLYKDIVKHHLCLFCVDGIAHIRDMDNERLAEFLKYRYNRAGYSIPNTAVPIDISGVANGLIFIFPKKEIKIVIPWEMEAKYLKTWADESSLECSATTMTVGGYPFERLCLNGRDSSVREKLCQKALDYGVSQKLIEEAWDFRKCRISDLNKVMVDEYIAQKS